MSNKKQTKAMRERERELVMENSKHTLPNRISKTSNQFFLDAHSISVFIFFLFLTLFWGCCLEIFKSSDFVKIGVPRKILMPSFHRFWPHMIWSYGHRDIVFEIKVTQCRKFSSTIFENFISPNPRQIAFFCLAMGSGTQSDQWWSAGTSKPDKGD